MQGEEAAHPVTYCEHLRCTRLRERPGLCLHSRDILVEEHGQQEVR